MNEQLVAQGEQGLALRQSGPFDPQTPDEAMAIARWISQSGLLGKKVQAKAETIYYLMATGHSLGMTVAQSLRAFDIIDDVPALKAKAQIALVRQSPLCEYFRLKGEPTDESATWVTKRRGDPEQAYTYTADKARARGLIQTDAEKEAAYQRKVAAYKRKNWDEPERPQAGAWDTNRSQMLTWRAATALIDIVYSDVTLGLPSSEDLADQAHSEGRIIDVTPQGEVVGQTEEEVAGRARKAQVRQDIDAIKGGNGDQVAERLRAEEEVKAKFTGTSSEIPAAPKATTPAAPTGEVPGRGKRDILREALTTLTEEQAVEFWKSRNMVALTDAALQHIPNVTVEKLLVGLAEFLKAAAA